MSADRLREAAKVLRERAEAATQGDWTDVQMGSEGSTILVPGTIHTSRRVARVPEFSDAAYIATMHPGVGLALADWLEADSLTRYLDDGDQDGHPLAHQIADLILGGAS